MSRRLWVLVLVGSTVCVATLLTGVLTYTQRKEVVPNSTTQQSLPAAAADPTSLSIYTSGAYGFAFFYPATATIYDAYSTTSVNGTEWRVGATAAGTAIVSVQTTKGEVRIGTNEDRREVSSCMKQGPAEEHIGEVRIGSTTWNQFSFEKLGTDTEQQVESYRAVHNGSCYALEVLTPLQATSADEDLLRLVQSFTFVE